MTKEKKTRQEAFEERMFSLDQRREQNRRTGEIVDENTIVDKIVNEATYKMAIIALAQLRQPDAEIFLMHSNGLTQTEIGKLTHRTQVYVHRSIKRTRGKLLLLLRNEYL